MSNTKIRRMRKLINKFVCFLYVPTAPHCHLLIDIDEFISHPPSETKKETLYVCFNHFCFVLAAVEKIKTFLFLLFVYIQKSFL